MHVCADRREIVGSRMRRRQSDRLRKIWIRAGTDERRASHLDLIQVIDESDGIACAESRKIDRIEEARQLLRRAVRPSFGHPLRPRPARWVLTEEILLMRDQR